MKVKGIIEEDWTNYKKSSMVIMFNSCTFKCEKESGVKMCQNNGLVTEKDIDVDIDSLVHRYVNNPITSAVVFGGLEPFDSFEELHKLVKKLRNKTYNDIIIYTGYYENEIEEQLNIIKEFPHIIVKFGRYIPNSEPVYSDILGVVLASENQYAKKIS